MADKRLAYRIVETALREALGEASDLGDWQNLPLNRLLSNRTRAETFWLSVLIQVNALTKTSFSLFEYIDPDRHRKLENTGTVVADEVEKSILMAPSTLGPSSEIGRYSRERVSTIEGLIVYADMERQRRGGGPSGPHTSDLTTTLSQDSRPDEPFHAGGRHIDIEPTWPETAGDARTQREAAIETSYGAPAPTAPAPAPPAPSAPAPKGKPGFSLKDLVAGAPLKTTSTGPPDATAVSVFYATDRLQLPKLTGGVQYSRQRSLMGSIHYGKCEVSIPASHKVGKLETPSILRLEFRPDPKKHIVLTKTNSLEEEEFFVQAKASVSRSTTRDAFIFIHGYNVSFEDAARRTGQMAYDLDFVGAPVFYSWPSNGKVADYPKDETNITWSTPHFQRFLKLMSERSGAGRIHIIAHSMGNRAVCDALKALSYDINAQLKFNHLVLAAPDIDAETFQELAATLQRLTGRITLYQSSKDKALSASKGIHGNPRAGEPLLVIPGLDTIDASQIDTDFLGHSYFSSNWPLLSDIHAILFDDKPPAGRFGLMAMEHKDGRYYAFRK